MIAFAAADAASHLLEKNKETGSDAELHETRANVHMFREILLSALLNGLPDLRSQLLEMYNSGKLSPEAHGLVASLLSNTHATNFLFGLS